MYSANQTVDAIAVNLKQHILRICRRAMLIAVEELSQKWTQKHEHHREATPLTDTQTIANKTSYPIS